MNLIQYWKEKNKQDFDAFVKTNTSVSQIQALTELKKDAVELTTDEFGRVEVVEIDAIDKLISKIEGGNPIVENNKTITDQYIGQLVEEITLQEKEVEQLTEERNRYAETLAQYQMASDKEIRAQIKQAKIEVLNKLRERVETAIDTYFNLDGGGYYLAEGAMNDIDELIREVEE